MFGKKKQSTPTGPDAALLRDGLVQVLDHVAADAPPDVRERLRAVTERLGRFPVPTGLAREIESVLARARGADAERAVGEALAALGHAMSAAAMLDPAVDLLLDGFRKRLPAQAGADEATLVRRRARTLVDELHPIRARVRAARKETARLVASVASEITNAEQHVSSLDRHTAAIAASLVEANDADGLRALLSGVDEHLKGVRSEVSALKARLSEAQSRARELEDVTRAQTSQLAALRKALATDKLTGAVSRAAWEDAFPDAVTEAGQCNAPLSLLVADIDHFKRINDTFGHPAGDAVLAHVCGCMREAVRGGDIVARVGGEEFAVLLPDADTRGALEVAEKLRAAVEALRFRYQGSPIPVTVSVGVATLEPNDDGASLYARADAALYDAKTSGRNRCSASASMAV